MRPRPGRPTMKANTTYGNSLKGPVVAHFTSSETHQSSASPPTVSRWADELGKNQALDTVSAPLRPLAKIFTHNSSVRNVLEGNFMGHALHPDRKSVVEGGSAVRAGAAIVTDT